MPTDDRVSISLPAETHEDASERKGDHTWAEVVRAGVDALESDEEGGAGQDAGHPAPLTAEDVPMLAREVADEVENRMTRR